MGVKGCATGMTFEPTVIKEVEVFEATLGEVAGAQIQVLESSSEER